MRVNDTSIQDDREEQLRPGEYREFQIDLETGRGGWRIRRNPLLLPLWGMYELSSDIVGGRMRMRDWVFLGIVLAIAMH